MDGQSDLLCMSLSLSRNGWSKTRSKFEGKQSDKGTVSSLERTSKSATVFHWNIHARGGDACQSGFWLHGPGFKLTVLN